ncbi:hypothetical protein MTR67_041544 [Solanum verrucosum]|uniref:NADH:quinone oxidoreductase/Mrp antiporter transmembrane domain-containing protein n=1 Tax=Solanum verrucosum TaxID=315347 RepID=A0AAF0ULN1_SOLVR|nr:hypothetical protein MTR67_041544 [Solanum verrucosum]
MIVRCFFYLNIHLRLDCCYFCRAMMAFLTTITGIIHNDLEKVVAYSTCSQLSYIIFTCDISIYSVSVFQ